MLFSSERATEGHPDKDCDHVADAIPGDLIANDPDARVALNVAATTASAS